MLNFRGKLETVLTSGSSQNRRPAIGKANESNVKGLYIIGDLAGAPVIKLAMAQAVELVDYLSSLGEMQQKAEGEMLDVLVIGAGAAGLNAALACQDKDFRCVLLEKGGVGGLWPRRSRATPQRSKNAERALLG